MKRSTSSTSNSKIVDINMRKNFDATTNTVTKILFDIIYEQSREDGSIYRYVLTDLESPFLPYCHINTEVHDTYRHPTFDSDETFYEPYKLSTLEIKDCIHIDANGCKVVCIKEPDPIDVTMEEIESKFGRKVRIVKEKNNEETTN